MDYQHFGIVTMVLGCYEYYVWLCNRLIEQNRRCDWVNRWLNSIQQKPPVPLLNEDWIFA